MPPFLVRMWVVVDAPTAGEASRQASNGKFRCVLMPPEVRAHGQFCVDKDCHLGSEMHGNFECKSPEWWRGLYPPPGYTVVKAETAPSQLAKSRQRRKA